MSSKRWVVIAGIVVVLLGVGYAAMTGLFPPKSGLEGTVGAAKRYQTEQISSSDVALQDAKVQAFLQSDLFHKMSTNATFRRAVLNQKTVDVLQKFYAKSKLADGADLAELLDGAEVSELMDSAELLNTVAGDELFKRALNEQEVAELAKKAVAARKVTTQNEAGFDAETLRRVRQVFQEAGVNDLEKKARLFENGGFMELMSEGNAAELLENADMLELLSDDGLAEMFHDGDLQGDLLNKNAVEALRHAPAEMLSKAVAARSSAQ